MVTFLPSLLFISLQIAVIILAIKNRKKDSKIFRSKILQISLILTVFYMITGFFHSGAEGINYSSIDYFALPIVALLISFLILNKPDLNSFFKNSYGENKNLNEYENLPFPIVTINKKEKSIYWNDQMRKVTGYSSEQIYSEAFRFDSIFIDFSHPASLISELLRIKKENTNLLLQVRTGDSKILIFDFRCVPAKDNKNDELFYAGKDVSEYIESEEKFFITEQKFRRMVDNFPFGSMIVIEGKIDFINSTGLQILGAHEQKELLGKEAMTFFPEGTREKICAYCKNISKNRVQVVSFEEQLLREDQQLIDAEIKLLPFDFYENSAYQIIFTDITERNLSQSEKQILSYAIEQSPGSVLITDTEGIIEYANPKYYEITGYEEKDIIGKNARVLNAGFHSKEFYKHLWSTIKDGKQWAGTFCNMKKNGEYFWESALISGVKNQRGKITHFVAVKEDITNKIKASQALARSEQLFRSIYENTSVGIFRLTREFDITIVNPAALKIFEYDNLEEMKNYHSELRIDKNSWLSKLEYILRRDGEVSDYHVSFINKKNNTIYLKIDCKSINDDSDETAVYEGIIEDITSLKRAEFTLIEAKEKAERSNKLKTDFLAQISHEIRTPINAILSFSTLLKNELQDKVNDDLKEGFDIIENGSRRLTRTIDLILNMSQIQTGNYDLTNNKINILKDVLNPLGKDFEIIAKSKKLELKIDNNFQQNSNILGDHYTITQLFANLIDNAIKYTNSGKVEVKLVKDKSGWLRVDVADTGIGISSDYLPKVFEPFSQEETGYTRRFEGTGLGLSLVKKYCEINGAEIEVKSSKDHGSIFSVSFKESI